MFRVTGRDLTQGSSHSRWRHQGEADWCTKSRRQDGDASSAESKGCQGPTSGGQGRARDPSRQVCHVIAPFAWLLQRDTARHAPAPRSLSPYSSNTDFASISHIWEAIRLVWPDSAWASNDNYAGIESRL
jgi:hypothetical protein